MFRDDRVDTLSNRGDTLSTMLDTGLFDVTLQPNQTTKSELGNMTLLATRVVSFDGRRAVGWPTSDPCNRARIVDAG